MILLSTPLFSHWKIPLNTHATLIYLQHELRCLSITVHNGNAFNHLKTPTRLGNCCKQGKHKLNKLGKLHCVIYHY